MPSAEELDRRAVLARLVRKLRADCIYFGLPERDVMRWDARRLITERDKAVKRLMEAAPTRTGDATW